MAYHLAACAACLSENNRSAVHVVVSESFYEVAVVHCLIHGPTRAIALMALPHNIDNQR
jgi:hypothetical protein